MSSVVLTGDTSGSVTLTVPLVAGSNTATLAAATGTHFPFSAGTAVNSTSGTSIDFTSIPSWVKRITVMFNAVSTSGTSDVIVQLGTGGTPTTSGYTGVSFRNGSSSNLLATLSSGLNIDSSYASASAVRTGNMYITLLNSATNNWTATAFIGNASIPQTSGCSGTVSLSGVLNLVRITTINGTDTFDAGSINILFE